MEQSLPVESGNRLFRAYTLNFKIFFKLLPDTDADNCIGSLGRQ